MSKIIFILIFCFHFILLTNTIELIEPQKSSEISSYNIFHQIFDTWKDQKIREVISAEDSEEIENLLKEYLQYLHIGRPSKIFCLNLGDERCINDVIIGSGKDGAFLHSNQNPGR